MTILCRLFGCRHRRSRVMIGKTVTVTTWRCTRCGSPQTRAARTPTRTARA